MQTSKVKKTSTLKRGFKAGAEKTSLDFRNRLGLKEYDPLSATKLAEYLKINIIVPSNIPGMPEKLLDLLLGEGKDCWSGAIFIKNEQKYVILNPTHSPARQESTLMHEIAHDICGHELKELETAFQGCVIPLRNYDHKQEEEAECLGSCLQLSQKALFYHFHIRKRTASQIAQLFNASKQMVDYRLRISGVLKIKLKRKVN